MFGYTQKVLAVLAATLSIAVVWSEVTFFNKEPVLSIFAIIVNMAKIKYDYFTIEVGKTSGNFKNHIIFQDLMRLFILFPEILFTFQKRIIFTKRPFNDIKRKYYIYWLSHK